MTWVDIIPSLIGVLITVGAIGLCGWLDGRRHRSSKSDAACRGYQTPATAADSGICARCGMYDYKHQEQPAD